MAIRARDSADTLKVALKRFQPESAFDVIFESTTALSMKENPCSECERSLPKKVEHTNNPMYEYKTIELNTKVRILIGYYYF